MIHLKSEEELIKITESAQILSKVHGLISKNIKPGLKTLALDKLAEEYILDHKASPSFKNYNGFPYSLCISVNSIIVHGFPGNYEIRDGDLVSIDCGVYYNGYHADSAYTHGVGNISADDKKLLDITKQCLVAGIDNAVSGNRIGDIAYAIQFMAESNNFSVVRELVGHGIGCNLHEAPEVPNYGKRGQGLKLVENMVLAIEPMINAGKRNIVQENDGWTIRTRDKMNSAHFEHTVVVKKGKAQVLTTFDYIEDVTLSHG